MVLSHEKEMINPMKNIPATNHIKAGSVLRVCLMVIALFLYGLGCSGNAYADGSLLPNAEQQFIDGNGVPYASGLVYFYTPNTTTPKNTYTNPGLTILNTNPVVLDAAGRAIIYGNGAYRQVLKDVDGNTVWDQLTKAPLGPDSVFDSIKTTTLLSGTSTASLQAVVGPAIPNTQILGTDFVSSGSLQARYEASTSEPVEALAKSRSGTIGTNTIVQNGDGLGRLQFYGADGTNLVVGAFIRAVVDAAPGNNDMPTSLVFATSPDGSASPSNRLTISNAGVVNIAGLTASSAVATDASRNLVSIANTGTGNNVLDTAPTVTNANLVTPTIGAATATSINFGSTALSAYSTGTWVPVDSSGASLALTSVNGKYERIGPLVIAFGTATYPSTGNGTNALIGGLPYTANNSTADQQGVLTFSGTSGATSVLMVINSKTFGFWNSSSTAMTNANLSTKQQNFILIYTTSDPQ